MAYSVRVTDETTLVAIDECGEAVSRLCTELLRGSDTRIELRAVLVELSALLDRLDELEVSR